ncbi:MAG: hypothetical protein FWF90_16500, partial [Promicromonosporaceae bacterium]|nr:hypothetical protein [Promicromonosporaceae bacterium]
DLAANTLKTGGTHITPVGIGPIVGQAAASVPNLAAIGSPDAVITGGWADAAEALRDAILYSCTPHLTVEKYTVPWNWTEADGLAGHRAGAGWVFTASDLAPTSSFGTMSGFQRATDSTGQTTWFFEPAATTTVGSVTITETQQLGYSLVQRPGDANAVCTQAVAGGTPSSGLGVENEGDLGFRVGHIGFQDSITCQVVNRRPAPASVANLEASGTYGVDYTWGITKQVQDVERNWVDEATFSTLPGGSVGVDYRLAVTAQRAETHRATAVSFDVTRPAGANVGSEQVRVVINGTEVHAAALSGFPVGTTTVSVPQSALPAPGSAPATVALYIGSTQVQSTIVVPSLTSTTNATAALTDRFLDSFADVTAFADAFGTVTLDATAREALTGPVADGASVTDPTEGGPLAWEFRYPATLAGPTLPDASVQADNIARVTPGDDVEDYDEDDATVIITTEPVPPRLEVTASAAYSTDYTWEIVKQVRVADADDAWADVAEATVDPGSDATFEYRLVVRAVRDSTPVVVNGQVVVSNNNATPLTLADGDLVVELGEVSVPLQGAVIPARGSLPLSFQHQLAHPVAWPLAVTASIGNVEATATIASADVTVTNATARLTDTFAPPFAGLDAFGDAFGEVTLDAVARVATVGPLGPGAVSVTSPGADGDLVWDLVYRATIDGPALPGDSVTAVNEAVITPDDDGDPDEDEAKVIITTDPVAPRIEIVAGVAYSTDYTWEIVKQVRVAGSDAGWVDEARAETVPGGDVAVEYRLVVRAVGESTNPVVTGAVRIHNDNASELIVSDDLVVEMGGATQTFELDGWGVPAEGQIVRLLNNLTPQHPVASPLAVTATLGAIVESITVTPVVTVTNGTAALTDAFVAPFADLDAFGDAFGADVVLDAPRRTAVHADPLGEGASVTNPGPTGDLVWELVYPATLAGPTLPGDSVTADNTAVVTPDGDGDPDDDDARVIITTPAVAPRIDVSAEAEYATNFTWEIVKQVRVAGSNAEWADAADARAVPGSGVEFEYRLVVRASGTPSTPVAVSGEVVVHNDNATPLTLEAGDVVVQLGGVTLPLPADALVVPATGNVTLAFSQSLGHPVTWPLAVDATLGSVEDSATIASADVDRSFTNATAVVSDTFVEFEDAFEGEADRRLDALEPTANAQWDAESGAWVFTYTAVRGEEVPPGGYGEFENTATVDPDGDGPSDDDDAIVTVRTGLPLEVVGEGWGTLVRTYGWELVKQVQDVNGTWVDAATLPADADGNAEFRFRVIVRPAGSTDSDWAFQGLATIHNDNAWDVTARNVTATISGVGLDEPVVVQLGDFLVEAGGSVDLDLAAILEDVDYEQFDSLVISIAWDEDEAFSTETADSFTIQAEWDADHAPVNRVVNVYDDLAGTVDAPVLLGTIDDWYGDSADAVINVRDGVDVAFEDGEFRFMYSLVLAADDGELSTTSDNRAWISGHDDENGVLDDDETQQTIVLYDLALRTWVNEVFRPGATTPSYVRYADFQEGPDYEIPYTTFDDGEANVYLGDELVKPIVVFNQGEHAVRVTEIVHYLDLEDAIDLAPDNGWDWEVRANGNAYLSLEGDDAIVLEPGEHYALTIRLVVTGYGISDDDALIDERDPLPGEAAENLDQRHVNLHSFVEISGFEGYVPAGGPIPEPEEPEVQPYLAPMGLFSAAFAPLDEEFSGGLVLAAPAAAEAGTWMAGVVDIDSTPYSADHLDENGQLNLDNWVDNTVTNTGFIFGSDVTLDATLDEDDHDGEIIRVVFPVSDTEDPPEIPTPPAPAPAPTPGPGVSAETGGAALGTSVWGIVALGAAALTALLGMLLLRRRRDGQASERG